MQAELPGKFMISLSNTHSIWVSWWDDIEGGFPARGTISMSSIPRNREWYVERAVVEPDGFRGRGIGSKMLQLALREARRHDARVVRVSPGGYAGNTNQQMNFYLKNGFERTSIDDLLEWRPDGGRDGDVRDLEVG